MAGFSLACGFGCTMHIAAKQRAAAKTVCGPGIPILLTGSKDQLPTQFPVLKLWHSGTHGLICEGFGPWVGYSDMMKNHDTNSTHIISKI